MSQLEANTMNNTTTNFDDNMLPPAPASVKRDVTIILYNNDYFINRYDTPPPLDSNTLENHEFLLPPPAPELTRIDTLAYLCTEEIIHQAYIQELLFCPWLEFKKEDYSGLPYDPIYLTHLNQDIRKHLASKLPQPPKLERQTNGPLYSGPLMEDELGEMPPSPLLVRTDSEQYYINPFGRNDSS